MSPYPLLPFDKAVGIVLRQAKTLDPIVKPVRMFNCPHYISQQVMH